MCLAAVIGGILAASPLAAQTLGRTSISGTAVIDEAGSYVLVAANVFSRRHRVKKRKRCEPRLKWLIIREAYL